MLRVFVSSEQMFTDGRSGHQDVMGVLEDVCEESLQATGFFHGGAARNEVGYGIDISSRFRSELMRLLQT